MLLMLWKTMLRISKSWREPWRERICYKSTQSKAMGRGDRRDKPGAIQYTREQVTVWRGGYRQEGQGIYEPAVLPSQRKSSLPALPEQNTPINTSRTILLTTHWTNKQFRSQSKHRLSVDVTHVQRIYSTQSTGAYYTMMMFTQPHQQFMVSPHNHFLNHAS